MVSIGRIILEYEDGSIEYILSDETFKTSTGGLLLSDMKEGDIFDANQEPEGWKLSGSYISKKVEELVFGI